MLGAVLFSIFTAALKSIASEIAKPGGTYASQMIPMLCCAEGELRNLRDAIETVEPLLRCAEKRQWNDLVKFWLKRLEDVLYDVQDLFDDISTEDLRRQAMAGSDMMKEVRLFFSESNQLAHCFNVANMIRQIRKKVDEFKCNKEFGFESCRDERTLSIVRRTTPTFEREEDIIGREEDRAWIISRLLDSSPTESVSVVSIVGMGGLGKTTLADLVYKDQKVKDCFELKMWVCHGDPITFDVDLMVKEILNCVIDEFQADPQMKGNLERIENKSGEQLLRLLIKALDGKKYLLVLDDLWNDDRLRWRRLRPVLMGGSRGSKILLTTRHSTVTSAVAWAIGANSDTYHLDGLPEDKSWDLLKKMAFGYGETILDSELEKIGRDIVQKCVGVPLAIKTIGSLLPDAEEKDWLNFKEGELSKIDGIMEVLELSYDHLPPHLKLCFAYCALFPKDYVFDKQTMIQLWMAQGFIESSEGNDDLEEIGASYVSNLLCWSFLEVETSDVNKFKMLDLMHDLALKVAGDECKMINLNEGDVNKKIRHASFASQSSSLPKVTSASLLEATNLRTFLSLKEWRTIRANNSPNEANNSPNEDHEIISKLRRCRALGLGCGDFRIPPSLGSRLKHLRFLDVSNNPIQNLPDSITDLFHLQTLKLSGCLELKTLPKDLKKLVKLRHLLIDGCVSLSHMPSLGELPSLRRLTLKDLYAMEFIDEHGTQWRSLPKLRVLRLLSLPKLVALPEGIQHITTLESLDVSGCENLMNLPKWIGNFSLLQKLDVTSCSSLMSLPHGISRLTTLRELKIHGCPTLLERCQRESGADWEKIARLPCSREGIIGE